MRILRFIRDLLSSNPYLAHRHQMADLHERYRLKQELIRQKFYGATND